MTSNWLKRSSSAGKKARGFSIISAKCSILALSLGCAGVAEEDGGPFLSESGHYSVLLESGEVGRGDNAVELCVTKVDEGEMVDGLVMRMNPFMVAMGHGSMSESISQPLGAGCYRFDGVNLNMPGSWELRTDIESDPEDYVAPTLYVR
jgi:hypothetical protein